MLRHLPQPPLPNMYMLWKYDTEHAGQDGSTPISWLLKNADRSRPGADWFPSDTYYRFNLDSTYDTLALVPDQENLTSIPLLVASARSDGTHKIITYANKRLVLRIKQQTSVLAATVLQVWENNVHYGRDLCLSISQNSHRCRQACVRGTGHFN